MGGELAGSSEDRLRKRLKEATASDEQINHAIAASTRSHMVHNRALKEQLKALTAQINDLRADTQGAQGGRTGNPVVAVGGVGQDRLLDLRDEIVDAKAALTLATERMDAQAEEQSIADLTVALAGVQAASRQMLWTLRIGLTIVVPAVAIVLAITVWRAFAG